MQENTRDAETLHKSEQNLREANKKLLTAHLKKPNDRIDHIENKRGQSMTLDHRKARNVDIVDDYRSTLGQRRINAAILELDSFYSIYFNIFESALRIVRVFQ